MASLLRVVPQVCNRDLPWPEISPKLLTEVARNSYSLIAKQAMLPAELQIMIHNIICNEIYRRPISYFNGESHRYYLGTLNENFFCLKKNNQGYRVDILDEVWERASYFMEGSKGMEQKYIVGCPAMAKVGEGEASVKKLWDWHVDIGEKIYRDLWSARFEPAGKKQARFDFMKQQAEEHGFLAPGIHF